MASSRSPLIIRGGAYVVLRSLKFIRHSILRARTGSRKLRYRVRESAWSNALWRAAAFWRSPLEAWRRSRMADRFDTPGVATMDRVAGYKAIQANRSSELAAALDTCREIFDRKVVELELASADDMPESGVTGGEPEKRKEKRAFLRNLLDNDDLRAHPQLVEFALSDRALGVAANYLQMVPYLNRVDLLYSVARPTSERIASQLFHVDPEGVTQVKFFVNVFDTDDAAGPFTFIPADETARVLRDIRRLRRKQGKPHVGRYTDEEIATVGGSSAVISVKGPAGSGVAVDTSRCLHLGSRVKPGSFRPVLYLQYCATLQRGNVFDVERFRDDPIRYSAIKYSSKWTDGDVFAPHQMG
jgi:hypothetical protein